MTAPNEGKGQKIVFIGEAGVGKTCIIARFTEGTFDHNQESTVGASYASKTIEIPEIKQYIAFDIWDTAGQEKYKSITKIFFKGAKMAVLVYDITRRETFDIMKNDWYNELKEHGDPNIVLAIAGNKSDLYEKEKVPEQEAREFAKSIDAVFKLTSAQKNTGIDELFIELGKKFFEYNSGKKVKKPHTNDNKDNIIIGPNGKKKEEQKKKCC